MNVQPIEMDMKVARELYLQYRARCVQHREQRRQKLDKKRALIEREDEELRAAYRALSLGQRILNLTQVFRGSGLNEKNQPKLAVARAGTEFCFFRYGYRSRHGWSFRFSADEGAMFVAYMLPEDAFPVAARHSGSLRAVVPAVPARFRPAGNLNDYFVLWEAEWTPIAPADPMLLKHIGGDMFAVLAQWDLTAVEKMVLEGRFSR